MTNSIASATTTFDARSISVTIVTRNRSAPLRDALMAVRGQTRAPRDIVVVDNASTDETVAMLGRDFPEVRLIRMHRNIGCQPARNIAMANCQGEIIFNLDDDGRLETTALEQAARLFAERPEVGLVAAAVQVEHKLAGRYANFNGVAQPYYSAFFIGAAHAIRRDALAQAGYFPDYVRGYSEPDLALRLLDRGWMILVAPSVIMYHDLSPVERSDSTHTYFCVWHALETSCRLEPAVFAWAHGFWRCTVGAVQYTLRGHGFAFLRGVGRFLLESPRILRERCPISTRSLALYNYLLYRRPASLSEIPDLERAGVWRALVWKFRPPSRSGEGA